MKRTRLLLAGLIACLGFHTAIAHDQDEIRAMTRNLYVGANIFRILAPVNSELEFVLLAGDIVDTMLQSNFRERAELIADEIKRTKPHVVGLQEVTRLTGMQLSDDPRMFPDVDFLTILESELAARGLNYVVPGGAISSNANVFIPALVPVAPGGRALFLINLLDRDVILVRGDIAFDHADSGNYFNNAVIMVGGGPIEFTRGWGSVDIDFGGQSYRFLNTHLEVNTSPEAATIQAVQALELLQVTVDLFAGGTPVGPSILAVLEATFGPLPLVLAGDFNSDPDGPCIHFLCGAGIGTPYQMLSAGFLNAWVLRKGKPKDDGNTCCFSETLDDPDTLALLERLDHIWMSGLNLKKVKVKLVGNKKRTDDGMFPSDHLGVFAELSLDDDSEDDSDDSDDDSDDSDDDSDD